MFPIKHQPSNTSICNSARPGINEAETVSTQIGTTLNSTNKSCNAQSAKCYKIGNETGNETCWPPTKKGSIAVYSNEGTADTEVKVSVGAIDAGHGFLIPKTHKENAWIVEAARVQLRFLREDGGGGGGGSKKTYRPKWGAPEPPLIVYRETADYLLVPRFWALGFFKCHELTWRDVPRTGVQRAHMVYRADRPLVQEKRRPQVEVFEFVRAALESDGGAIAVLPVGGGKTNIGLYTAAHFGVKTLWIAHRNNLVQQAAQRAAEFFSNKVRIGWLYAEQMDVDDKDIVFGTVQSLGSKLYDPALFEQFGLVVLDEAHHAAAPQFVEALFAVAAPKMLALTANPERQDGLNDIIRFFFSNNVKRVPPALPPAIFLHVRAFVLRERSLQLEHDMCDAAFRRKQEAQLRAFQRQNAIESTEEACRRWREEMRREPDDVSDGGYTKMCSALGKIAPRNALLVALIKKALVTPNADAVGDVTMEELNDTEFANLCDRERSTVLVHMTDDGSAVPIDSLTTDADRLRLYMRQCERQVLVASFHKELLNSLQRRLVRSGVPAHMIGRYCGDEKPEELRTALMKRIVLVTYSMAEEGLDVPTANTLVKATPRGDAVYQTIGRVMRDKMTPAIAPLVFDVNDAWCGMADGLHWKRRRHYKQYPLRLKSYEWGGRTSAYFEPPSTLGGCSGGGGGGSGGGNGNGNESGDDENKRLIIGHTDGSSNNNISNGINNAGKNVMRASEMASKEPAQDPAAENPASAFEQVRAGVETTRGGSSSPTVQHFSPPTNNPGCRGGELQVFPDARIDAIGAASAPRTARSGGSAGTTGETQTFKGGQKRTRANAASKGTDGAKKHAPNHHEETLKRRKVRETKKRARNDALIQHCAERAGTSPPAGLPKTSSPSSSGVLLPEINHCASTPAGESSELARISTPGSASSASLFSISCLSSHEHAPPSNGGFIECAARTPLVPENESAGELF